MTTCPRCDSKLIPNGSRMECEAYVNWYVYDLHVNTKPCPCDYSEIRTAFDVVAERLPSLTAKIAKIARKAVRFGVAAPTITAGDEFERVIKINGVRTVVRYVRVIVAGVAPKLNGWEFCAVVDHDGEENILRGLERSGMPERYRSDGPTCEHCKLSRRRNETFVLKNEDGRWARVGRSCLADFLGHASPAAIAAAAEYLMDALGAARGESEEDGLGAARGESEDGGIAGDPAIETYCAFVACAIRKHGWTPRSAKNGEATADVASEWLWAAVKKPGTCPTPDDADRETAEAALEWARGLAGENDFEYNLRAASKRAGVARRNEGLTAYIVAGHLRAEAKRREPRAESQWIGTVGQRFGGKGTKKAPGLPALRLTVVHVSEHSTQWGASYLNILRDEAGNAFKWFGSECLETGSTYDVAGTVKAHAVYGDVKQTVLTRCSCVKVEREGTPAADVQVGQWRTRSADDVTNGRECKHVRIDRIDHKGVHYALFVCGIERYSECVDPAERLADCYPVVCDEPAIKQEAA